MARSSIARDLTEHMSQQVQGTMMRLVDTASAVLPADELLIAMITVSADVVCSAVASAVASAGGGNPSRTAADHEALIGELLAGIAKTLTSRQPLIVAKVSAAVEQFRASGRSRFEVAL